MKILVTGGAGYIGSVLVRQLLASGHKVRVLDNLSFGGEAIVDLLNHENFEFLKGDICEREVVETAMKGMEAVAHLASIVGDPACAQNPDIAKRTNIEGSKLLYEIANSYEVSKFIFASTCSNYGKMTDPNEFVSENSELKPVSLYAETKVAVERFLLNAPKANICKPTCLRFSTVYGLSPRPRFDLTVNEFSRELALGRELVIFGEQFWRPYCHVVDLARSVSAVLDAPNEAVSFNVFNVGDTSENYQKKMIVSAISKQLKNVKVKYVEKNEDPRDYRVSFEKIKNELGFSITKKVPDGIRDIIFSVKNGMFKNPDDPKFSNI